VRTSPCNGITGDPTFCNWDNAVYAATTGPPDFHGAVLAFNGLGDPNWDNAWKITKKDGTVLFFPEAEFGTDYRNGAITSMADRYGNSLTFDRTRICCRPPSQQGTYVGDLLQVTSSSGRFIQFTYDSSARVTQAKDSAGRTVGYSYDGSGRLSQVTDANGGVWNYTYDSTGNMLTIQDPRGIFYLSNRYDANNRVIQQTGPDNKNSLFSYTTDQNNNVTSATVTDPRGLVEQLSFDANGYITRDVFAQGKPEQQTFTYTRDPNTELVTAAIDPLNRETDYAYDGNGNVTSITRLA
jgi:YD repeat-containing protein